MRHLHFSIKLDFLDLRSGHRLLHLLQHPCAGTWPWSCKTVRMFMSFEKLWFNGSLVCFEICWFPNGMSDLLGWSLRCFHCICNPDNFGPSNLKRYHQLNVVCLKEIVEGILSIVISAAPQNSVWRRKCGVCSTNISSAPPMPPTFHSFAFLIFADWFWFWFPGRPLGTACHPRSWRVLPPQMPRGQKCLLGLLGRLRNIFITRHEMFEGMCLMVWLMDFNKFGAQKKMDKWSWTF